MENHSVLTFTPVEHPDARVQRLGFDLSDPYVEHCWGPVIGPSATLLLRRIPTLWTDWVPATISQHVQLDVAPIGIVSAGLRSRACWIGSHRSVRYWPERQLLAHHGLAVGGCA